MYSYIGIKYVVHRRANAQIILFVFGSNDKNDKIISIMPDNIFILHYLRLVVAAYSEMLMIMEYYN